MAWKQERALQTLLLRAQGKGEAQTWLLSKIIQALPENTEETTIGAANVPGSSKKECQSERAYKQINPCAAWVEKALCASLSGLQPQLCKPWCI